MCPYFGDCFGFGAVSAAKGRREVCVFMLSMCGGVDEFCLLHQQQNVPVLQHMTDISRMEGMMQH